MNSDKRQKRKKTRKKDSFHQFMTKRQHYLLIDDFGVSRGINNFFAIGGSTTIFQRSLSQNAESEAIDGSLCMELRVNRNNTEIVTYWRTKALTEIFNWNTEIWPKGRTRILKDGSNNGISCSQLFLYFNPFGTPTVELLP